MFVVVKVNQRGQVWFKSCRRNQFTLNLPKAKRYRSWEAAQRVCEGTSWGFCHEDEVDQLA